MGMMLRLHRRGMVVVRRRLGMGLRRKWATRRRGGTEGMKRHGWLEGSVVLR